MGREWKGEEGNGRGMGREKEEGGRTGGRWEGQVVQHYRKIQRHNTNTVFLLITKDRTHKTQGVESHS
jgi:hypothetical protein